MLTTLVFTVCVANSAPQICETHSALVEGGMVGCMVGAQATMLKHARPGVDWEIKEWRCKQ